MIRIGGIVPRRVRRSNFGVLQGTVSGRCPRGTRGLALRPPQGVWFGPLAEAFGRYELLRCLGRGGMAEVFLARVVGEGGFRREVVVKRILPHLQADPELVRLFVSEARLAARLHHPNIVQVFDFGQLDGQHYIVMERIAGKNVAELARVYEERSERMPPELAVHVAHEVLSGLAHAHSHRDDDGTAVPIIHRDVTPSNVMVSANGEVKLVDFGIAKAAAASGEVTRVLRGKASYLSPEQVAGHPVDHRSDIFSVGVVLWELLSGARLFAGGSEPERLRAVVEARVPPLGGEALPAGLDAVVQRALARDPAGRPQTAAELAAELRPFRGRASREWLAVELERLAQHSTGPRVVMAPHTPASGVGRLPVEPQPRLDAAQPETEALHGGGALAAPHRRRTLGWAAAGLVAALLVLGAVVALRRGRSGPCLGAGCVVTVAGDGQPGFRDGPSREARLDTPYGLALGRSGALYVADGRNHRIRLLRGSELVTLAGDGERGDRDCPPGPRRCALGEVRFSFPAGLAVLRPSDDRELVVVADGDNATLRWLLVASPCADDGCLLGSGTLAGAPRQAGFADGPGATARFENPKSIAASPSGQIFVADQNNHRIRRVDLKLDARGIPAEIVVGTIAGDGVAGYRDGAALQARLHGPRALDWLGDAVYFTDGDNHLVRVVRGGRVETVAGACRAQPCPKGHVDGALADARFDGPRGIVADASGDLYVSELGGHDVRLVSPSRGIVRTIVGRPGHAGHVDALGQEAELYSPHGLVLTTERDLVVADLGNHVLRRVIKVGELVK